MTGTIILIVLISIEIILLASGLHWQKVVKAGDADDFCFGFQITMKSCPEQTETSRKTWIACAVCTLMETR